MSKVDAQRAMREARYAAYRASRVAADAPRAGSLPTLAAASLAEPADLPQSRAVAAAGEAAVAAVIQARTQTPDSARACAATKVALQAAAAPAPLVPSADPHLDPSGEAALCGHRNIAGKSCQRPTGHAEKNHRYR
jgi:hypothetical protein